MGPRPLQFRAPSTHITTDITTSLFTASCLQTQWYHGSCGGGGEAGAGVPPQIQLVLPSTCPWLGTGLGIEPPSHSPPPPGARSAHRETWVQGLPPPLICQDISAQCSFNK